MAVFAEDVSFCQSQSSNLVVVVVVFSSFSFLCVCFFVVIVVCLRVFHQLKLLLVLNRFSTFFLIVKVMPSLESDSDSDSDYAPEADGNDDGEHEVVHVFGCVRVKSRRMKKDCCLM